MADSKDKQNDAQSDDFADDLDAMLNEAEASVDGQDELIDDEDAIDRLLMDDAFDDKEETTVDDVDQLLDASLNKDVKQEKTEQQIDEFDEFADEEKIDSIVEGTGVADTIEEKETIDDTDDFDVDDLINSAAVEATVEDDEFAEIDEFSEDIIEPEPEPEPEAEAEAEAEDDFLLADFDISADDEFTDDELTSDIESSDEASSQIETEINIQEPEPEPEPELIEATEAVSSEVSMPTVEIEKVNTALVEINNQIKQLSSENASLKLQVAELAAPANEEDVTAEEIDSLQKEQRKLSKLIKENDSKVPVMTYVAIGIAILALLIGGGLGLVGYGAQSEVTNLSELVVTLEEEIEILTAKNNTKDVKAINEKITLLIAKDEEFSSQLSDIDSSIQTNPLKPVVDDLVIQNDHAQEAIELLLAKVETLEIGKSRSRKAKKAVAKIVWVVNLVSFKQEWYAKRKSAEFKKKGVPAEVNPVKVKGENWFRLTVKGFNTKYEAAAYAVKVKKTLNLTSVWVTKG